MADYSNGVIPYNLEPEQIATDARNTLGLPNIPQWCRPGWLCSSDRINPWSGIKPVNGGFDTVGQTGFTRLASIEQEGVYQYEPVRGGLTDLYVIDHFVGYRHKAWSPNVALSGAQEIWIAPGGTRQVMITYNASDLNFRADGYNALLVLQEMQGGGKSIIGGRYLSEIRNNAQNTFDVTVNAAGLAVGFVGYRNLYVGFGMSSAPNSGAINAGNSQLYKIVGYTAGHFKTQLKINCTHDGVQPPPPQQWGRIVVTLVGAPTSVIRAVESIGIAFASNTGDRGAYMRQLDIGYNESQMPSQADDKTFKGGVIRLWWLNPQTGTYQEVGLPLTQNPLNRPANGASFARVVNNQIQEVQIKRPIGSEVYKYQARWSYR